MLLTISIVYRLKPSEWSNLVITLNKINNWITGKAACAGAF